ncbi:peptidyl-prolyl cis-trans isomerase protein, putative [Theileria equi strain WA]|uniref:Peptidyl-prolyl cis-trans isomerase n=1 Tax=Theileria equi strain WA TaxID=1537102 RepID=L1LCC2_THEEQ|nr:peptidyl-prolyl cis-trans isomerase protein, putative [Theileria equi strain WA]EKX72900.1 peptidyl-prolyl cis-trans isomerase protein, putative [Theileria equi strain WA]|eukprot:XP_004832352.1 peptidyl-prolyl cis-trans isomerase protein, putative [Theileria equi strain WA]
MSVTLHTSLGDIKIELYCKDAPKACKNFLALCASDYYNETKFHRNIEGFLVQGGDPSGTGKGGESIYDTPFEDEIVPHLKFDKRGVVAMANPGKPNSNASQFFITYSKQAHLNGQYTIFGRVISGMDTLDALEKEPVGKKNRPLRDIILKNVIIHANPIADMETSF